MVVAYRTYKLDLSTNLPWKLTISVSIGKTNAVKYKLYIIILFVAILVSSIKKNELGRSTEVVGFEVQLVGCLLKSLHIFMSHFAT